MNTYDNYPNSVNYGGEKIFISKEQEIELYEKMKEGDELARDDLIVGHKYLVFRTANEYSSYGSYDDLVQEGFVGLIRSVDKYDVNIARLRTYALPAIRQEMLRFLNRSRHAIQLPEPHWYALLKLLKIKDEMEIKLGREPNTNEIMENEEVIENYTAFKECYNSRRTLKDYIGLLDFAEAHQSLNAAVFKDSEASFEEFIEDPRQQSDFERVDLADLLESIMCSLDDREKFILNRVRDGLSGREIGKELNLTTQAVSMIKLNAIKKIKITAKNDEELKEVLNSMGIIV